MKQILLALFTITFLFTQACSTAANENDGKDKKDTESTVEKNSTATSEHKGAIHLTKDEFLKKVANYEQNPDKWVYLGDKPCVIDFYADWCRPCKIAGPILEDLAIEYQEDIYVYKINTEHERELAAAFGIQSIPAFLFCPKEGNPQMSNGIAKTNEETKQMFKSIIDEFLLGKK
ncbi:MAG: thiol reductase thioredoxin [Salinivirgaceae bacterium]|nr:thiol reductase thioredoxin [Salinivirgaceae bacterium]